MTGYTHTLFNYRSGTVLMIPSGMYEFIYLGRIVLNCYISGILSFLKTGIVLILKNGIELPPQDGSVVLLVVDLH